ncbi:MAG: hypothetical protein JXB14_04185, partial [Candidatus Altiarchaeota archaeon]|nr:hypothetical protein [Candidatus Altiarchaeota archaeon]
MEKTRVCIGLTLALLLLLTEPAYSQGVPNNVYIVVETCSASYDSDAFGAAKKAFCSVSPNLYFFGKTDKDVELRADSEFQPCTGSIRARLPQGAIPLTVRLWYPREECGAPPAAIEEKIRALKVQDGTTQYLLLDSDEKVYFKGSGFYSPSPPNTVIIAGGTKSAMLKALSDYIRIYATAVPSSASEPKYYLTEPWATSMILGFKEDEASVDLLANKLRGIDNPLVLAEGGEDMKGSEITNVGKGGKLYVVGSAEIFFDKLRSGPESRKDLPFWAYRSTVLRYGALPEVSGSMGKIVLADVYGCDGTSPKLLYKTPAIDKDSHLWAGDDNLMCDYDFNALGTSDGVKDRIRAIAPGHGSLGGTESTYFGDLGSEFHTGADCEEETYVSKYQWKDFWGTMKTGENKNSGNIGDQGVKENLEASGGGTIAFRSGLYQCATYSIVKYEDSKDLLGKDNTLKKAFGDTLYSEDNRLDPDDCSPEKLRTDCPDIQKRAAKENKLGD